MELAEPGLPDRLPERHPRRPSARVGPGGRARPAAGPLWTLGLSWTATRVLVALMVAGVVRISDLDVTTDVSVIYHGWFDVLRTGTFPLDDVAWQYPPAAALVLLAPGLLPWSYAVSFYVLMGACDALTMLLLTRAGARGRRYAGAWLWVVAVPLLGPTAWARYDLAVTAAAVGGLLALRRSPWRAGLALGFGALLKVWPALAVVGTPPGRRTRDVWASTAATVLALGSLLAAAMHGALGFLTAQRDRGVEVESLGALAVHLARVTGHWHGRVALHYGSVEFLGPWIGTLARLSLAATAAGAAWLLLWRLRATAWAPATPCDAALTAVLLFTTTSRVISPQYMIWLVGIAAACLVTRGTTQRPVALLLLPVAALTTLEFPVLFGDVVGSTPRGVAVLTARDLLLLAATLLSAARLWRATVLPREREPDAGTDTAAGTVPGTVRAAGTGATTAFSVRPGIAHESDLLTDSAEVGEVGEVGDPLTGGLPARPPRPFPHQAGEDRR